MKYRVAYYIDIAIFAIGINLIVLLGNPVYNRWFLDGSDPDLR